MICVLIFSIFSCYLIMDNLDIISKKMIFIYNALDKGWAIKKKKNTYVFTKNHEGKKEVMLDDYLKRFMLDNLDINNLV